MPTISEETRAPVHAPTAPLPALAAGLPGAHLLGGEPPPIAALASHADAAGPGALFFCLPGSSHDGHAFAPAAVARGAAAVVVERPLPALGVPQLLVPDARAALAHISRAFHGFADRRLLVLAVTGTNGKTTTAHMLHAVFAAARYPMGLLGTVCYRLGRRELPAALTTPEPVRLHAMLAEMVDAGLRGVAMEASSHALSQRRLDGLEVDTAVFTNLSRDHLDYHGSYMAYYAAKRRLFGPRGGGKPHPALAVVGVQGPAGRRLAREAAADREVVTFALGAPADVTGGYRRRGGSSVLSVSGAFGAGEIPLPLPGAHNARNALAAAAAGLANGLPMDTIAHALARLAPVPGRFEPVGPDLGFALVVDFAHNPDGLRCALLTARARCGGRVRLVFGCKGGDGDDEKRRRMGALAGRLADMVYLTTDDPYGEDPARIAGRVEAGLRGGPAPYRVLLDRAEAIRVAVADALPGDLVLVAGRGHETQQPVQGGSLPLDDRRLCRLALEERAGRAAGAPAG